MNKLIRRSFGTVAALCFLMLLAVTGHCAIIRVSTTGLDSNDGSTWARAKLTVQAGINAAVSGDEVWVAAGTYLGCITLKGGVGLYGGFAGTETERAQRDWNANVTILDGSRPGSVVTTPSAATSTTLIDGFTIRNGMSQWAYGGTGYGGGISCNGGSPTISNNTIIDNGANDGGGISCGGGSPIIASNTITDNKTEEYGESGAGISCDGGSPTISNNTITGNSTSGDGGSGGISCGSGSPTISNNTITGNSTWGWANKGGGISCGSGSPTISHNTIAGNSAHGTGGSSGYGGGIACNGGSPIISDNTITGNGASSYGGGGYGGGISCYGGSPIISSNTIAGNSAYSNWASCYGGGIYGGSGSPIICNNTITDNTASGDYPCYGGGIYGGFAVNNIIAFNSSGVSAASELRNNCVYNPAGSNYEGCSAGTGDISADPLFVDASSGNYHLRMESPCRDAGDNSVVQPGWTDLDGRPRIFPTGGIVDMGCYESGRFVAIISSPTETSVYSTNISPLAISGTIMDNMGNVTSVTWSNNRGGSGACTGTAAWSADGIVLQPGVNIITVTASDDASNTIHVALTVYYYSVPSTLTILAPTSGVTYTTTDPAINLSGISVCDVGIASMVWSNSRGGSGNCTGTTAWSVSGITLQPGVNVVTITATDVLGNSVSANITVTRAPASIGVTRQLTTGSLGYITDATVSATNVGTGSVFVESADRSSGIKLVTGQSLSVGQSVQFTGTAGRVNGEYQISNVTFLDISSALTALTPLCMTSSSIGNDVTEQLNYVGLNTTGLLIRYAGKVVLKSTAERFVYVDDGGDFKDGVSAYFSGIRVYIPADVTIPDKNKNVVITGILRPEKHTLPAGGGEVNGDWYPEGTIVYIPSIWLRDAADVRVL